MNTIDLDEKVGERLCDICKVRKAKRRLGFNYGTTPKLYTCDLCFDDLRNLMVDTFWIGTRKTREQLMKENPDVSGKRSNIAPARKRVNFRPETLYRRFTI